MEGMLSYRLYKFFEKGNYEDRIPEMLPNRHETVYELVRERLKNVKGRNGMLATTYIEYWEKHKDLKKVSATEWHLPCGVCGEKVIMDVPGEGFQLDHGTAYSRGGTSEPNNILPIHTLCNQSKATMSNEEYVEHCRKVVKYHEENK